MVGLAKSGRSRKYGGGEIQKLKSWTLPFFLNAGDLIKLAENVI